MSRSDLSGRIIDQFSERGDRADIWQAFDLLLPTDRFLNVGYSRRYQTHLLGSPQLRLVERVVDELSSMNDGWADGTLLDLGCGRGGAATYVTDRYGPDIVGIDLVPYNIATAYAQTSKRKRSPAFVIGDATRMPFDRDTFSSCVAIDSVVYVHDKRDVFAELSRVLEPAGVCVISDLLVAADTDVDDRALQQFANAWDMPRLWTFDSYRTAIETAELRITNVTDLTPNSVKRFRKWTTLFLLLADGPLGHVFAAMLARQGLDPETIIGQIRAAHGALPGLQHLLVAIRGADARG